MAKIINYSSILKEAWNNHLQPRAVNAPTVISTFAGGGGSSLGYSIAGFKELLAVEFDKNAVETLKHNFINLPVFSDDIAKLTVSECLNMAGITEGELDVIDGSPPCQGFSTSGNRNMNDTRNTLFTEFVRLLKGIKPKIFVMENVSGMVKGKMKLIFAEILKQLKGCGYIVKVKLMDTSYYNVPQKRQRLIFLGIRNDVTISPSYPEPNKYVINVRDALHGTHSTEEEIEHFTPVPGKSVDKLLIQMKQGDSGREYHPNKAFFNLTRLSWNKPSITLVKIGGDKNSLCGACHPIEHRKITITEAKRIQSFPDEYSFTGDYGEQWARIGNSVPPLFMAALAAHIRTEILDKTN